MQQVARHCDGGNFILKTTQIVSTLLFLCSAAAYSEEEIIYPYCDASYRVSKYGQTRDIEIQNCVPEDIFPKYKSRTKRFVAGLEYDPKTVDGEAVDSLGMKVRVVFEDKYYKGIKTVTFPENQQKYELSTYIN